MKAGLAVSSAAVSGSGLLAGNITFDGIFPFTIKEILDQNNVSILDMDNDEELWLVLAQQYRENGTTQRFSARNFNHKNNPGFLSDEEWELYAKNVQDFSKDEELSAALKQTCFESLSKPYTESLYSQVTSWCTLNLPDYVKNILKIQKENGDCRFWLIKSSNNLTGWFVWEAFDDNRLRDLISLEQELQSSSGSPILQACKSNPRNYVELSFHPAKGKEGNSWQVSTDWKQGNFHRLPIEQRR